MDCSPSFCPHLQASCLAIFNVDREARSQRDLFTFSMLSTEKEEKKQNAKEKAAAMTLTSLHACVDDPHSLRQPEEIPLTLGQMCLVM